MGRPKPRAAAVEALRREAAELEAEAIRHERAGNPQAAATAAASAAQAHRAARFLESFGSREDPAA